MSSEFRVQSSELGNQGFGIPSNSRYTNSLLTVRLVALICYLLGFLASTQPTINIGYDAKIMQYRRAKAEGGTYFFTLVTHNRRQFLCQPENISLLREAFRYVMERHLFKIDAIVILPEHLHCIWTLPLGDSNFSTRWRLIKSYFSRYCDAQYRGQITSSRQKKKNKPSGKDAFGNIKSKPSRISSIMWITFIIIPSNMD